MAIKTAFDIRYAPKQLGPAYLDIRDNIEQIEAQAVVGAACVLEWLRRQTHMGESRAAHGRFELIRGD